MPRSHPPRFAPGHYFIRRDSPVRPPRSFLSEDVSLLEFRPRFFRQSVAWRSRPRFPLIDSRKCRVPKLKRLREKRWWERSSSLETWTETFPSSASAFFIPLFITPSLKVSLSSFVTLIQRATRPGNFSREGEGNFAAAILRAARCNFSQGKRAKIPAAFLLKNEGTGQERESTKESRGGNVTAMVSRIFKEGKGGS